MAFLHYRGSGTFVRGNRRNFMLRRVQLVHFGGLNIARSVSVVYIIRTS